MPELTEEDVAAALDTIIPANHTVVSITTDVIYKIADRIAIDIKAEKSNLNYQQTFQTKDDLITYVQLTHKPWISELVLDIVEANNIQAHEELLKLVVVNHIYFSYYLNAGDKTAEARALNQICQECRKDIDAVRILYKIGAQILHEKKWHTWAGGTKENKYRLNLPHGVNEIVNNIDEAFDNYLEDPRSINWQETLSTIRKKAGISQSSRSWFRSETTKIFYKETAATEENAVTMAM